MWGKVDIRFLVRRKEMSKKKEDFFDSDFWTLIAMIAFISLLGEIDGHGYVAWFFTGVAGVIGMFSIVLLILLPSEDVYGNYDLGTSYSAERVEEEIHTKKINYLRAFTGITMAFFSWKIAVFLLNNNITTLKLIPIVLHYYFGIGVWICRLLGVY